MAKTMRSFRSKMIMLFALSMILAGGVTYLIYEGLRLYYKLAVRYEDPLAQFRSMVRQIGDINFFLIIFIPLSIMFFFFLTRWCLHEVQPQRNSSQGNSPSKSRRGFCITCGNATKP
ncbi:hypothetical protein ABEY67_13625, partial [Bacillus mycoides]